MNVFTDFFYGLSVAFTPLNLLSCFIGCLLGTLVGVLPGVGPGATIAILLPLTFKMPPTVAVIMLAGIYYGAQYGGSTTSILLNIPGESTSVVTCLDGYQMARQGRAGPALGIAAFGSFIAGTFGVIMLMFIAPAIVSVALRFGSPEYVGLIIMSLSMVSFLSSSGSRFKATVISDCGSYPRYCWKRSHIWDQRFSFGITTLYNGIGLIPVVVGLFGVAEVLLNLETVITQEVYQTKLKGLLPNWKDWRDSAKPIVRGSFIGFFPGNPSWDGCDRTYIHLLCS